MKIKTIEFNQVEDNWHNITITKTRGKDKIRFSNQCFSEEITKTAIKKEIALIIKYLATYSYDNYFFKSLKIHSKNIKRFVILLKKLVK